VPTIDPISAIKWPSVPACHGWLSLDQRGTWRLKGQPVRHAGLISFINSHYGSDDAGNWIFQNGPQAVYVTLDYTPLVLRLQFDGGLIAHAGAVAEPVAARYIDDEGNALLDTVLGIGLLDDRDLPAFLAGCRDLHGEQVTEDAVLAAMAGCPNLIWRGIPIKMLPRHEVALRFGFQANPAP
jgi:hypothetical protein